MGENQKKIEQRLSNMKNFYGSVEKVIDMLPASVPASVKRMLKEKILGDEELKAMMEGIDQNRPPRFFLTGRTGVGKSSLINALCGFYAAGVSDTKSCTGDARIYQVMDGDRVLMEIMDTRGTAESEALNEQESAEDQLIREISEFGPDAAILVLSCTHRDDVAGDARFFKKLQKSYIGARMLRLPIVAVVNKCDEMAPARIKDPEGYPKEKEEKIARVVSYYRGILEREGLIIDDIVGVASLIDWADENGSELDAETIAAFPEEEKEKLTIAFDGRYRIGDLIDILEKAILDVGAQMGLRMAARFDDVVHRFASHLVNVFAGISASVALTPIPVSDLYILITLQAILVALIASLSGRSVSFETAKEFVFGCGGVTGAGLAFRTIAQQAGKLLNALLPGSGSAVSSAVAAGGTRAMGQTAIAYYLDGVSIETVRRSFMEKRKR